LNGKITDIQNLEQKNMSLDVITVERLMCNISKKAKQDQEIFEKQKILYQKVSSFLDGDEPKT
jgi:hypothetical protein